jgi:gamma-glutamyltranspeptidase/glutathione hydrolase
MGRTLADRAGLVLLGVGLLAGSGCSTIDSATGGLFGTSRPPEGTPGHVRGFLGGVAADEPRAALAAREVLSAGGNAADAAVALGFMLGVTLPSRASLGGGGACLAYHPDKDGPGGGVPEAVVFVPPAGSGAGPRSAAVPTLARGLFALHARYGRRPFESLTAPAEQAARFGVPMSRALARDLAVVAGPLAGDPMSRAVFFRPDGQPLAEGETLQQAELAATLAQIRLSGVGDFHIGALARRFEAGAQQAGGGVTLADLRAALPKVEAPLIEAGPNYTRIAFLPPPADGGLAAAAAFRTLVAAPQQTDAAQARALGAAAAWRRGGADAAAILNGTIPPATLPPLPASTGFVTVDPEGRAVACALTMNNLFGNGRIAPGTGVVMAASPARVPPPLLAAALAWNPNVNGFAAAVTGSGQEGAALAAADLMVQALRTRGATPRPVPEPGRANGVACPDLLPDHEESCGWTTDPRGAGLAVGSN